MHREVLLYLVVYNGQGWTLGANNHAINIV